MSRRSLRIRQRASGEVLLTRARFCDSFLCHLRGLMFRPHLPLDEGLLLVEAREGRANASIHMLFMFFDIGVVWLSSERKVVDMTLARAWRPFYAPRRPARYTLECSAHLLAKFHLDDELDFEDIP